MMELRKTRYRILWATSKRYLKRLMSKYRVVGVLFLITALCSIIYSCQSENELNYARYYTNGNKLYDIHCQNCHGSGGEVLGKLIPPLTDTTFLKKHKSEIVCWVKHGI